MQNRGLALKTLCQKLLATILGMVAAVRCGESRGPENGR
jgi:hypothetical protein